jgi:hypothetical protein
MPGRTGRLDRRINLTFSVQLARLTLSDPLETIQTENISSLGVRVVSEQAWHLDERVWVTPIPGGQRHLARVVYCEPLGNTKVAVGLEFLGPPINWGTRPPGHAAD